jgi:hypothetical protein
LLARDCAVGGELLRTAVSKAPTSRVGIRPLTDNPPFMGSGVRRSFAAFGSLVLHVGNRPAPGRLWRRLRSRACVRTAPTRSERCPALSSRSAPPRRTTPARRNLAHHPATAPRHRERACASPRRLPPGSAARATFHRRHARHPSPPARGPRTPRRESHRPGGDWCGAYGISPTNTSPATSRPVSRTVPASERGDRTANPARPAAARSAVPRTPACVRASAVSFSLALPVTFRCSPSSLQPS